MHLPPPRSYADDVTAVVYYKEAPPGIVLVALRVFATAWVAYASYTSIQKFRGHASNKLYFFIAFLSFFAIWLLFPLAFWAFLWVDLTGIYRPQIFWAVEAGTMWVGQLVILILFFPAWPFGLSAVLFPFHAVDSKAMKRAAPATVYGGGSGDGGGGSGNDGEDGDVWVGGLRRVVDHGLAARIAHDAAEVELAQSLREARRLHFHAVSIMNVVTEISNAIHEIELPDNDEEEELTDEDEARPVRASSFGREDIAAVRGGRASRAVDDGRRDLAEVQRAVASQRERARREPERSRDQSPPPQRRTDDLSSDGDGGAAVSVFRGAKA